MNHVLKNVHKTKSHDVFSKLKKIRENIEASRGSNSNNPRFTSPNTNGPKTSTDPQNLEKNNNQDNNNPQNHANSNHKHNNKNFKKKNLTNKSHHNQNNNHHKSNVHIVSNEKSQKIPITVLDTDTRNQNRINAQKIAFDVNLASNATSGVQYRDPFRSRLWRQQFSNITETILENDGYQQVQRLENENLVNGVAPPRLSNSLEVALFRPGVYASSLFPNWLRRIPEGEIDYSLLLTGFKPPSQDEGLHQMARNNGCIIVGSTSSVTAALSQIYFLLSRDKTIYLSNLPTYRQKEKSVATFSPASKKPAIFTFRKRNGVFTIDSQSVYQEQQILIELGQKLEIFLTNTKDNYKEISSNDPTKKPLISGSSYSYLKLNNVLLRSQIDAYHPALAKQTFDLKTRATHSIRMNLSNYEDFVGDHITQFYGTSRSFEREFYDLARSAFLKYYFQAKIGNMDGIFVAYHNTLQFFGFEYLPLEEMENVLFENSAMKDYSFDVCTAIYEKLTNMIVEQCHEENTFLRVIFKSYGTPARKLMSPELHVYVDTIPADKDRGWSEGAIKDEIPESVKLRKFVLRLYTSINGNITTGQTLVHAGEKVKTYYKVEEDKETPQSILAMEYHEHLVSYVSGNNPLGKSAPPETEQKLSKDEKMRFFYKAFLYCLMDYSRKFRSSPDFQEYLPAPSLFEFMQKYHPAILTQISSSYLGQNSKYPAKYFGKNLFTMCSYIKLEWGIEEYSRRVLMKVISQGGEEKEYAYKYIGDLEDTGEPNKMDEWYNRFVAAKIRNSEIKGENLSASFSKLGGDMFHAAEPPASMTNE